MAVVEGLQAFVMQTLHKRGSIESPPELLKTWSSRTASFYHFRVSQAPQEDVVVKLLATVEDAPRLFQSMTEIASVLRESSLRDVAPMMPLAVSDALGAVIMPYSEGRPLSHLLRGTFKSFGKDEKRVIESVALCGRMLAAYHMRFADNSSSRREQAWQDLKMRLEPVIGQVDLLHNVTRHILIAKSYGDFHPGHVLVGVTNQLTLIDPPLVERYLFVQRDVAWFLDALFMQALRSSFVPFHFRRRILNLLSTTFLRAYEADLMQTRGSPLEVADQLLLAGFQAFLLQRRLRMLWERGAVVAWGLYLVPLFYRYLQLKRLISSCRRELIEGEKRQ